MVCFGHGGGLVLDFLHLAHRGQFFRHVLDVGFSGQCNLGALLLPMLVNVGGEVLIMVTSIAHPEVSIGLGRTEVEFAKFGPEVFVETGRQTVESVDTFLDNKELTCQGAKLGTGFDVCLLASFAITERCLCQQRST